MFLFLITGFFVLLTIAFVLRESIARFENSSLTTAMIHFFLSIWSGAGAMLSCRANDHDKENKSFILTGALIFLPPAALISVLSAMFFPMPVIGIVNGLPALAACAAFSTMWIGLFSGVIMAMLLSMKSKERLSRELFYCTGLIIGGAAFPMVSDRFNSAQAIVALAGIPVIFTAIVAGVEHFKQREFRALLWVMASCALLLDACGVYTSQKLFQMYWKQMPHVAEVNLLCPYKDLVVLALSKEMLPLAPGRFFVSSVQPEEYLQTTESKFDIIMILEPGFIRNPGNSQFYRLASDKLADNGVIVTVNASEKQPEDLAPEDNLPPLKNYVRQNMPVPGCAALTMSANSKLTSNLSELEDRLARVSAPRGVMMPRGVLTTLYSLPESDQPQLSPSLVGDFFNGKLQKSIMLPPPPAIIMLLVMCISVYITMRFFLSRTGNYALGFGTFENGFFTMGLFIILLIAYQQDKGDLYEKTPVFLGMLGGVGFGRILLRVPSLKTIMATISCLCPLLLYFNEIDFFYPLLLGSIFCLAVSAGMAEEILSRRVTLMKYESLPALRYMGHCCGIVFLPLILFQSNGVLISVILLLLLRLPLLFSAMPYQRKS